MQVDLYVLLNLHNHRKELVKSNHILHYYKTESLPFKLQLEPCESKEKRQNVVEIQFLTSQLTFKRAYNSFCQYGCEIMLATMHNRGSDISPSCQ